MSFLTKSIHVFGWMLLSAAIGKGDVLVTSGDPFTGGIAYRWTLTGMDSNDTATMVSHVGALSFEDPVNFSNPNGYFGWTHTSNWAQVELIEPAILTIGLTRTAGVPNGANTAGDQLFPAFAIWQGTDNDDGDDHVFNNSGNFLWAEDLNYIGNEPNALGLPSVSRSFSLAAGNYSVVLSGHPPGNIGSGRQGYTAVFSTSAIPEPTSLGLVILATVSVFATRHRRRL